MFTQAHTGADDPHASGSVRTSTPTHRLAVRMGFRRAQSYSKPFRRSPSRIRTRRLTISLRDAFSGVAGARDVAMTRGGGFPLW